MALIIIVAIIAYYTFFADSTNSTDSLLEIQSQNQLIGSEVLNLMNQVQSLKIDSAFFDNNAFKSLVDHTVAIPERSVGRDNPFAPISGFSVSENSSPNNTTGGGTSTRRTGGH